MSNKREEEVLAIYANSQLKEEELNVPSNVNHLAWSLLTLAVGVIFWMAVALINAENRRNAYANNVCPDPVFKGAVDAQCMVNVHSREHWWQHLTYAMSHLSS